MVWPAHWTSAAIFVSGALNFNTLGKAKEIRSNTIFPDNMASFVDAIDVVHTGKEVKLHDKTGFNALFGWLHGLRGGVNFMKYRNIPDAIVRI